MLDHVCTLPLARNLKNTSYTIKWRLEIEAAMQDSQVMAA